LFSTLRLIFKLIKNISSTGGCRDVRSYVSTNHQSINTKYKKKSTNFSTPVGNPNNKLFDKQQKIPKFVKKRYEKTNK